jgi:hypothetical protein
MEERAAFVFTVEDGGSTFLRDVSKYIHNVTLQNAVFFSL